MIKQHVLLVGFIFFVGCAPVDLRGKGPHESFSQLAKAQGRQILTQTARISGALENWPKFSEFRVRTTDHWSSTIFRWLTPVQTDHQTIDFTFEIPAENSLMTYVDGKTPGDSAGIKDTKTYKLIKGKLVQKNFGDVQKYLGHVRHYFLFPQILKDYPMVASMGEGKFGEVSYDKVFAGTSDALANSKEDQYIVWVNRKTSRVDFIEFTIRDFLPSLHGVIVYKDYRQVQGIWLPFEIILPASMENQKPVHRFTIDSIELKP